ncbi:hypothetical protein Bca52824_078481 [Brassica carinata]|uniref:PLAT domain-containing protein n=1 Tax=Brassica carinata TaxID=52824 RepID=A0A8X7TYI0_BRACI|nr:hypothetical protein Bca52824_078481 [Brassica carinata]
MINLKSPPRLIAGHNKSLLFTFKSLTMARHDIHLLFVLKHWRVYVPKSHRHSYDFLPSEENCHYTISVKTGSRHDSGTDAVIGIVLADKSGKYNEIKNLVSWGGNMEPGRDYFENDYLDIFTGTEQCLPTPICFMTLNSDGSATSPTSKTGAPSKYQHFTVEQWLANSEPPFRIRPLTMDFVSSKLQSSIP